ncbi:BZIP transcription factor [Musa troglodytarum]|uniref:BZIP transcription factor n=1 Tax=Musa troglodytarum TaxID=320322 RepID=A0A9E7FQ94_9LILI|nr:BZIP transcription factor [Musa troglodytarum]
MDDGEVDLSSHLLLPNPELTQSFDEFLRRTTTCTHTHACNPPGPAAAAHSHTCYHTHTQVFAAGEEEEEEEEEGPGDEEPSKSRRRRPLGNREAVRKYREKKKAHAAFLEEEVKKLRLLNRQLLRRLQGQAALEAEAVRLRDLLADLRVKIDAELGGGGGFPLLRKRGPAGVQCDSNGQCVEVIDPNGEIAEACANST